MPRDRGADREADRDADRGAMRLVLLTATVMVAFAANSVLNRAGLAQGGLGPAAFAALRLLAGTAMLGALVALRRRPGRRLGRHPDVPPRGAAARIVGPVALSVYVLGFSFAYRTLDAGLGALLLFGVVQVTMFAAARLAAEPLPPRRAIGAAIAFAGLVWLLWPTGAAAPDPVGAALMVAAGVGWGVYSVAGRRVADPLAATAANFALALPVTLLAFAVARDGAGASAGAVAAALTSGAITSGLAYALWYAVLPRLAATQAAVAQLTVPVIALAGGALLLGEAPSLRLLLAGAVVLGGVAFSFGRGR